MGTTRKLVLGLAAPAPDSITWYSPRWNGPSQNDLLAVTVNVRSMTGFGGGPDFGGGGKKITVSVTSVPDLNPLSRTVKYVVGSPWGWVTQSVGRPLDGGFEPHTGPRFPASRGSMIPAEPAAGPPPELVSKTPRVAVAARIAPTIAKPTQVVMGSARFHDRGNDAGTSGFAETG